MTDQAFSYINHKTVLFISKSIRRETWRLSVAPLHEYLSTTYKFNGFMMMNVMKKSFFASDFS